MTMRRTDYKSMVSKLESPGIDDFIRVSEECVPAQYRQTPWKLTEHGVKVYGNDDELACYMAAYGRMHKGKMEKILSDFPFKELDSPFEITDWGCGQGVATICLIDYLKRYGKLKYLKAIKLVEPSTIALDRAITNISAQLGGSLSVDIQAYNEFLPGYGTNSDIYDKHTVTQPVSIDLFSNILDIGEIDLKSLAAHVAGSGHMHYVLCVGPVNYNHDRIQSFTNYFHIPEPLFSDFADPQYMKLNPSRYYSCVTKGFRIECDGAVPSFVRLAYYPPKQFFAGYILDSVAEILGTKDREELSAFEVLAPFDIGASIYDDMNPVLAVLNNIVTRGLPTKASPFIEETLAKMFGCSVRQEKYGTIFYNLSEDADYSAVLTCLRDVPMAVARVEKTILEAMMTGRLELKDRWDVVVKEHDVPCGALAFRDLQLMFDHLCALTEDYRWMKFPEVNLTVISKEKRYKSLHLGNAVYGKVDRMLAEAEYDMVIDVAIDETSDPESVRFSEFSHVRNSCYFNIRSSEYVYAKRRFYTSDRIRYKELCTKDAQGAYHIKDQEAGHLRYFLQLIFRKEDFRPGQLPILSRALQNKPVIGLLPTGGGKSLTYQLAAMMQPGVSLVVDPIVSLMKDQVDGLKRNLIDCYAYVNSKLSAAQKRENEHLMESSRVLFMFLSPERLCIFQFRERLANMHETHVYFSYGVIDEVHCVSEWGHDFRTSYLHLGRNMYNYALPKEGNMTLLGLTATASFDVLADVERELSGNGAFPLDADTIVRYENTNRLELQYYVCPIKTGVGQNKWDVAKAKNTKVCQLLLSLPEMLRKLQQPQNIKRIKQRFLERENVQNIAVRDAIMLKDIKVGINNEWFNEYADSYDVGAIVFCPHVRGSMGVSDSSSHMGVSSSIENELGCDVSVFYGGADLKAQDDFICGKSPFMVATKAFGMGIDKPNVRFTVNMNYSGSLEGFVQEAGRAGRDQKMALAVIMYNEDFDKDVVRFFYDNTFKGPNYEKSIMYSLLSRQSMAATLGYSENAADSANHTVSGFMETLENAGIGQQVTAYISYVYPTSNSAHIEQMLQRLGFDGFTGEEDYLQAISKAIYRMCCIGLIEDFTQDYVSKSFRIVTTRHEKDYYKNCLRTFLERYYTPERAAAEVAKVDSYKGENEIHKCLGFLTEFVYDKIAAKRKRAIDDMETFCYNAVHSGKDWLETNEDMKDDIYFYFNSKYARADYQTEKGEPFSLTSDTEYGKVSSFDILIKYLRVIDDDVTGSSGSPNDNVRHLYGAVRLIRRSLTDSNPTIDLLNAFCLLFLKTGESPALMKELQDSYVGGWMEASRRTDDKSVFFNMRNIFIDELVREGRDVLDEEQKSMIESWNALIDLQIHIGWLEHWSDTYTKYYKTSKNRKS